MLRKILLVLALVLIIISVSLLFIRVGIRDTFALVDQSDVQRTFSSEIGVEVSTLTQEPKTMVSTTVVRPTSTSSPQVYSYVLNNLIDLASGEPIGLSIHLPEGQVLLSNWAGAVGYDGTDDQKTIFLPSKGIVYSYLGDTLVTQAHSGVSISGQSYFASSFEQYIRKNSVGQTASVSEMQKQVDTLRGSLAYLCQLESGEVSFLSDFDGICSGRVVELEIVATAVVLHEQVGEYKNAVLRTKDWLERSFPQSGFGELNKQSGWIVTFCVGQLSDQVSDGTPWYLYNRGVIGFVIRE